MFCRHFERLAGPLSPVPATAPVWLGGILCMFKNILINHIVFKKMHVLSGQLWVQ